MNLETPSFQFLGQLDAHVAPSTNLSAIDGSLPSVVIAYNIMLRITNQPKECDVAKVRVCPPNLSHSLTTILNTREQSQYDEVFLRSCKTSALEVYPAHTLVNTLLSQWRHQRPPLALHSLNPDLLLVPPPPHIPQRPCPP